MLLCQAAQSIGLSDYKLKCALKCTVWSQRTPVPDGLTDGRTEKRTNGRTNIMAIAWRFVITNASRARKGEPFWDTVQNGKQTSSVTSLIAAVQYILSYYKLKHTNAISQCRVQEYSTEFSATQSRRTAATTQSNPHNSSCTYATIIQFIWYQPNFTLYNISFYARQTYGMLYIIQPPTGGPHKTLAT